MANNSELRIKEENIDADFESSDLPEHDNKNEPFESELESPSNFVMCELVNENHISTLEDYQELFFTKKMPDCVLFSEEGTKFEIHKQLLSQTQFLRTILASVQDQCCGIIEILCPCSTKHLEHLVHFLYHGEIRCRNELESFEILDDLNNIFGFPKELCLYKSHDRQTLFNDEESRTSRMCEAILNSLDFPTKSTSNGLKILNQCVISSAF